MGQIFCKQCGLECFCDEQPCFRCAPNKPIKNMNLLECYVTEILGEPYFNFGFWWQKVKYTSYGVEGETSLMDKDKTNLQTIAIGFKFYN